MLDEDTLKRRRMVARGMRRPRGRLRQQTGLARPLGFLTMDPGLIRLF